MILATEWHFLFDCPAQFVGDMIRGSRVDFVQEHSKLVTAQAPQDVTCTAATAQFSRYFLQDVVTGGMTQRIVDLFEAVEVDEQDRAAAVVTANFGEVLFQALVEAAPIEQAGERIVVGEVL